ncbi:MAG: hypothetical protein ACKVTZ_13585 [Bacteroidia bacterium]
MAKKNDSYKVLEYYRALSKEEQKALYNEITQSHEEKSEFVKVLLAIDEYCNRQRDISINDLLSKKGLAKNMEKYKNMLCNDIEAFMVRNEQNNSNLLKDVYLYRALAKRGLSKYGKNDIQNMPFDDIELAKENYMVAFSLAEAKKEINLDKRDFQPTQDLFHYANLNFICQYLRLACKRIYSKMEEEQRQSLIMLPFEAMLAFIEQHTMLKENVLVNIYLVVYQLSMGCKKTMKKR